VKVFIALATASAEWNAHNTASKIVSQHENNQAHRLFFNYLSATMMKAFSLKKAHEA
jgi:hypothetical protein